MLAATTSINGTLSADNADADALFAQLMPTLAGNIATAIEFIFDPVPTFPGSRQSRIFLWMGLGHFSSSSPEIAERSSQKTVKKARLVASSTRPNSN
jgi:hypothetical protein